MCGEYDGSRFGRTHESHAQIRSGVVLDDEAVTDVVKAACEGVNLGLADRNAGELDPTVGIGVSRSAVEAAIQGNAHVRNRHTGFG